MTQDNLVSAEQLREVVRGKADSPLRRIEAELGPHWPAHPWNGVRRPRAGALPQPADNDAVRVRQPRFERSIDFQVSIGYLRPAHHAIGKSDPEPVRVFAELNQQSGLRFAAEQIVEGGG